MTLRLSKKHAAQLVVVLLAAFAFKFYYSTAGVNQLRWILAPTTAAVELLTGARFEFESHAGYMNEERTFVIAASCAGVNFLITAFLILTLRRLFDGGTEKKWRLIPLAAACAYLATLVANTIRISTALRLKGGRIEVGNINPEQLHRAEGIIIYFGFLLLLFMADEWLSSANAREEGKLHSLLRRAIFPLAIYYAMTLGIPFVNGAYRQGAEFGEHALFVLLTPLLLVLPLAALRFIFPTARSSVRALVKDEG